MSNDPVGGGRMSAEAQAELRHAVENDEITNAAEYAGAFALRYGLNPVTVKSAISRLRRELGLLKRPGRAGPGRGQRPFLRIDAVTLLKVADATDPRFTRVAAAALIRYQRDERFREAVDEQLPAVERINRPLEELRESAAGLPPEERQGLLKLFEND